MAILSFTGSTEVGQKLYGQCSSTIKRVALELGGNAPFIVFEVPKDYSCKRTIALRCGRQRGHN